MASTEFGTGKSIIVLAIVVGCFAILWPKIFYPMMQAAFSMTAPKLDSDGDLCQVMFEHNLKGDFFFAKLCDDSVTYEDVFSSFCDVKVSQEKLFSVIFEYCKKEIQNFCKNNLNPSENAEDELQERDKTRKSLNECLRRFSQKIYDRQYFKKLFKKINSDKYVRSDRPPHLNPSNVHPRLKEKIGGTRHAERLREGKPFPHPSARHPPKPQPKAGGAMSIIMPIYTIGIVVFFLYTVLKLVFKKQPLEDKKPMVKDFHMDPEYHKYVLRDEFAQTSKPENSEIANRPRPEKVEPVIKEKEDYEIYQLRKRLQEMEATMERIVSHMGAVSDCIAANIHANIPPNTDSASSAVIPAVPENKSKEKQLIEHERLSANLINTLLKENLKSCIDLSPTVESYEIIGNSYPTTPIEETKQINFNKAQISEVETTSLTENTSLNDNKLPLHQDVETIDISSSHQNEITSFDRESSVASEGSSFELLCHSRDTRSLSPTGCEDNGQKEGDYVGMGNKTDSIGSIDNISFEHFSSDGMSPDHQDTSFDSFVISDTKSASERK